VSPLLLHAPNVHQGGGRALLLPLIRAAAPIGGTRFILDARLGVPDGVAEKDIAARVPPTMLGRFGAERILKRTARPGDTVLCFGNLPPLFRLPCRVVVFLQNRFLLQPGGLAAMSWRVRARLAMERRWLQWRRSNADGFVVQTLTMQALLRRELGVEAEVVPFAAAASSAGLRPAQGDEWRFVYVASGEPHKNHRRLIDAWCRLAERGVRPVLSLTLDHVRDRRLIAWIESRAAAAGLKVVTSAAPEGDVEPLYRDASALIYPSLVESFGLPLIEARALGLPIIAAELDVVRDVLDPVQTFDPHSPISIARAVMRFMGIQEPRIQYTPQEFLNRLDGRA
jgi:glycosyltransferase involved in cell wall biosynthesis